MPDVTGPIRPQSAADGKRHGEPIEGVFSATPRPGHLGGFPRCSHLSAVPLSPSVADSNPAPHHPRPLDIHVRPQFRSRPSRLGSRHRPTRPTSLPLLRRGRSQMLRPRSRVGGMGTFEASIEGNRNRRRREWPEDSPVQGGLPPRLHRGSHRRRLSGRGLVSLLPTGGPGSNHRGAPPRGSCGGRFRLRQIRGSPDGGLQSVGRSDCLSPPIGAKS